MMSSGLVCLVSGAFVALLGFGAWINYSQQCYVNPGGFPCDIQYQVALLAPLYALSTGMIAVGLLFGIVGSILAYLGYSKGIKTFPSQNTESRPVTAST
jgi:hypothetical protein